ncbi:MAG: hypothetical protein AAF219_06130 [Myxococcota bacterium]
MKHAWTKREAWGKATAGLIGGLLAYTLSGIALGAVLPRLGLSMQVALASATVLAAPIWTAIMLWVLFAVNARSAWLRAGGTVLVLGVVTGASKLL